MKTIWMMIVSIHLFMGCNPKTGQITDHAAEDQPSAIQNPSEAASGAAGSVADTTFTFEHNAVGKMPEGWSQTFTGKGNGTDWKIIDDGGNKVLAQLSEDQPNYHFNDIVFDGITAKNMDLEVKMKGVNGKMDQGGGFIWRFTDADNYYVVRANPLENNVVLYKVENGVRSDLPLVGQGKTYGVDVDPLGNGWNALHVSVHEKLFTVYLNGKELFRVEDNTFTKAGKAGLWTKADAVTYFDEFKISQIQ